MILMIKNVVRIFQMVDMLHMIHMRQKVDYYKNIFNNPLKLIILLIIRWKIYGYWLIRTTIFKKCIKRQYSINKKSYKIKLLSKCLGLKIGDVNKETFEKIFKTKTRDEWDNILKIQMHVSHQFQNQRRLHYINIMQNEKPF